MVVAALCINSHATSYHRLSLLPFPDSPPPPPICIWSIHCPSPISIRIECVVELIAELRAISNPRCHGIDLNGNCASMSWALIEANWKCHAGELSGQPAKGYVPSFYINICRFNCIFRRYLHHKIDCFRNLITKYGIRIESSRQSNGKGFHLGVPNIHGKLWTLRVSVACHFIHLISSRTRTRFFISFAVNSAAEGELRSFLSKTAG